MISYLSEDIKFRIKDKRSISGWIKEAINEENYLGRKTGDISIVLTTDTYLKEVNKKFLGKDYYTDIITFDNSTKDNISADLLISLDRVRFNSEKYSQKFTDELHRVIIHGILHLLGYNDRKPNEKKIMTEKENYFLSKREWINKD